MSPCIKTEPVFVDFHKSLSILLDKTLELPESRKQAFNNAEAFKIIQNGDGKFVDLLALHANQWHYITTHKREIIKRPPVVSGGKTVLDDTGEFIVETARALGIKGEIRKFPQDQGNKISCDYLEISFMTKELGSLVASIQEHWNDKPVTVCVDAKAREIMVWDADHFTVMYV